MFQTQVCHQIASDHIQFMAQILERDKKATTIPCMLTLKVTHIHILLWSILAEFFICLINFFQQQIMLKEQMVDIHYMKDLLVIQTKQLELDFLLCLTEQTQVHPKL
ncbi:MAG: hypothetical protein CME98_18320 [Hyphomonas sp.]|nr:hypothetical protein [Hyphomonas sp.]